MEQLWDDWRQGQMQGLSALKLAHACCGKMGDGRELLNTVRTVDGFESAILEADDASSSNSKHAVVSEMENAFRSLREARNSMESALEQMYEERDHFRAQCNSVNNRDDTTTATTTEEQQSTPDTLLLKAKLIGQLIQACEKQLQLSNQICSSTTAETKEEEWIANILVWKTQPFLEQPEFNRMMSLYNSQK